LDIYNIVEKDIKPLNIGYVKPKIRITFCWL